MTSKRFDNVWDALKDDPAMAENLRLRSALMIAISQFVEETGLTQAQAADKLGTTQPRLNDVIKGRIEKCTVDRLVNMLAQAGHRVDLSIHRAA